MISYTINNTSSRVQLSQFLNKIRQGDLSIFSENRGNKRV